MRKKSSKKRAQSTPADQVAEQKRRVTEAVHEILHNPQTPGDLWEHVAEFVTETLNNRGNGDDLHHTGPMLALILDSVPETELRNAVIAPRGEGQS